SIGYMFAVACRTVLLQLLRNSRKGIKDRMNNPAFASLFEQLIRNEVFPLDELKRLRDQLAPLASEAVGQQAANGVHWTWEQARKRVVELFEIKDGRLPESDLSAMMRALPGSLVREGDVWKIRDSRGTLWSLQELNAEISLRTAIAEGI